ncbi:MAG TPA: aspartate 1-decarboxylase [Aquifex aeolicus]|uniref:Aspartate 1-decarboxylase n=1 Tax=Aquifex aeolicus TaxID=63363 RepID=A0A9D0YNT6_AQUAO|nr:aspartate 1-decarboxylase [Aquificales bacterium]HIP86671.1 aspartate 1-decarboxylase [Aquifex sp.]HIP97799.1 aspartate 1-decarboxylase [Aquifex aeolicus]HIQ26361.1 aspartate 1-decarboxylase [Aquifex aeolicus]
MKRFMLKSKIHQITVTGAELYYEGSLSLDEELMKLANLIPYEKVEVYNINNGERFSTYIIPAPAGSRICRLNGAAARKGAKGDKIIIVSYAVVDEEVLLKFKPCIVYIGENNTVKEVKNFETTEV